MKRLLINNLIYSILKKIRQIYLYKFHIDSIFTDDYRPKVKITGQDASDIIKKALSNDSPCMIARFGSLELFAMCSYRYIIENINTPFYKKALEYIGGRIPQFWLEEQLYLMSTGPGFFPSTAEMLKKFYELMIEDIKQLDILGSWTGGEIYFESELKNVIKVFLTDIEPYYHQDPWSQVLEGKKILVIHPFHESIQEQYKKRELLFQDPRILPKFDIITLPAVQSIAGEKVPFNNWFEALEHMKLKINQTDFDIALIGCGAYGFPLAAHIKRMGKKAIHMGGATQMLFGIKGRRWEQYPFYLALMNDNWIRPSDSETPVNSNTIEKGCYW